MIINADDFTKIDFDAYVKQRGYRLVGVEERDAAVMAALDRVWDRLREEDDRVPPVLIDLTPGRSSSCSSVDWFGPSVIALNLQRDGANLTGRELLEYLAHQAGQPVVISPRQRPVQLRWYRRSRQVLSGSCSK